MAFLTGAGSGMGAVVTGAKAFVAVGNSCNPCGFSSLPTNPAEVAKSSRSSSFVVFLKADHSRLEVGAEGA